MGGYLDDGLVLAGALLVTVGAGMVYVPAGVMVAGGFLVLAGVLVARSSAVSRKAAPVSMDPTGNTKKGKRQFGQDRGQEQFIGEDQGLDEDGLV